MNTRHRKAGREYTEAVGKSEAQNDCVRQCLSRSLTDSQEGSELNKPDLKKEKAGTVFGIDV